MKKITTIELNSKKKKHANKSIAISHILKVLLLKL